MERLSQFAAALWMACLFSPVANAAGVFDPDQGQPVSRFGEFTDSHGRIVRKSEQVRDADEEDAFSPVADHSIARESVSSDDSGFGRSGRFPASDAIRTGASARSRSNSASSEPLGTLRRNGVQEVAVIAGDLGFFPRTVFVTKDIPVRLFVTGSSKNPLCIMMDSFNVRKQVKNQSIEEVSFTPERPGRFRFYCPINGAEGYLVVREFGGGEDS